MFWVRAPAPRQNAKWLTIQPRCQGPGEGACKRGGHNVRKTLPHESIQPRATTTPATITNKHLENHLDIRSRGVKSRVWGVMCMNLKPPPQPKIPHTPMCAIKAHTLAGSTVPTRNQLARLPGPWCQQQLVLVYTAEVVTGAPKQTLKIQWTTPTPCIAARPLCAWEHGSRKP